MVTPERQARRLRWRSRFLAPFSRAHFSRSAEDIGTNNLRWLSAAAMIVLVLLAIHALSQHHVYVRNSSLLSDGAATSGTVVTFTEEKLSGNSRRIGSRVRYDTAVRYEFRDGAGVQRSNRINLLLSSSAALKPGDRIEVLYDKENPSENTLRLGLDDTINNALGSFALSAPVIALYPALWLFRYRQWRRRPISPEVTT